MSLDKNALLLMERMAISTVVESALRTDPKYQHLRTISIRRSRMLFEQPDVLANIEKSMLFDQTVEPNFDELVSSSRRVLFFNDRVLKLNSTTN